MSSPDFAMLDDAEAEAEPWQLQTPELRAEVKTARQVRRDADAPVRQIQRRIGGLIGDYLQARAAGLTKAEAVVGIEKEIRERFRRDKYPKACDECEDTGYVEMTCWERSRCGRRSCDRALSEYQHRFVAPCVHCSAGQRFMPRHQQGLGDDDELAQVGRRGNGKARGGRGGFSGFGR